ncbi:MAG: cyclopropane-fatty-acyl-phospholipid synthase family protein [Myxococcota bacterium]
MSLLTRGLIPDVLLRAGIRFVCAERLRKERRSQGTIAGHLAALRSSPIAIATRKANEQHYEVPPAFFRFVLGPRLKYSAAYFPPGVTSLATAEESALALVSSRAELQDGQRILELGCGWGSLTLWMAERFPASKIVAVSNSAAQRNAIEASVRTRKLTNVEVRTADMNAFAPAATFDRVVSVEMFEHMRNWEALLRKVASWLNPEGRVFLHVFAHRRYAYLYENEGRADWMAREFFSGGQMPSHDMLSHLETPFSIDERWRIDGTHYARTAEAWLRNLDAHQSEVLRIFRDAGASDPRGDLRRWRIFFLACAECFAFRGGSEWGVSHYRLVNA